MKTKLILIGVLATFLLFSCKNDDTKKPSKEPEKTEKGDSIKVTDPQTKKDSTLTYKVSLGVMPDLGHKGPGVKVARVTKDRPGYFGGLQVGDIIMKIDDNDVNDLYKYTELLGKHKKGDSVVLTVNRDNKTLKMNITFD